MGMCSRSPLFTDRPKLAPETRIVRSGDGKIEANRQPFSRLDDQLSALPGRRGRSSGGSPAVLHVLVITEDDDHLVAGYESNNSPLPRLLPWPLPLDESG